MESCHNVKIQDVSYISIFPQLTAHCKSLCCSTSRFTGSHIAILPGLQVLKMVGFAKYTVVIEQHATNMWFPVHVSSNRPCNIIECDDTHAPKRSRAWQLLHHELDSCLLPQSFRLAMWLRGHGSSRWLLTQGCVDFCRSHQMDVT